MKPAICAIITPPYPSAVGLIRCSGKDVISLVANHFRPAKKLLNAAGHSLVFGTFYNELKQPLDEILISVF